MSVDSIQLPTSTASTQIESSQTGNLSAIKILFTCLKNISISCLYEQFSRGMAPEWLWLDITRLKVGYRYIYIVYNIEPLDYTC